MARHGATGAETWNEKANQKVVPDIETKENPGYNAWCRGGVRTSLEPRRQILSHSRAFFCGLCVGKMEEMDGSRVTDGGLRRSTGMHHKQEHNSGRCKQHEHNTTSTQHSTA